MLLSHSYLVGHCDATARATDNLPTADPSACAANRLAMQLVLAEENKSPHTF